MLSYESGMPIDCHRATCTDGKLYGYLMEMQVS
jgi:hypothetical protein